MNSIRILVDADACPVKDEIYRVAERHGVKVSVVSNSWFRVPVSPMVERVVVGSGFDAADDWIVEQAGAETIVVTTDTLLADRALKAGAVAIAPTGKLFDSGSIGTAVATRALMEHLRATGDITGGPPPFQRADRSRFLSALDLAIVRMARQSSSSSGTSPT